MPLLDVRLRDRQASKVPTLTMQMLSAGCEAFRAWDPNEEEPEALIVAIYFAMAEEARKAQL